MNDKYGADLGEGGKVWVDQQWVVVKQDDERREVALNDDRSQFEMVLEQKIKDLLLERHDKNGVLFDLFFATPTSSRCCCGIWVAPMTSFARRRQVQQDRGVQRRSRPVRACHTIDRPPPLSPPLLVDPPSAAAS